jgi:hypothetical protein
MGNKEGDSGKNTQLIVAVIGLIGVLLTVFVPIIRDNIKEKNLATQTPIIIVATPTTANTPVPTDTVPPGMPTSTPAPTSTPVPLPIPTDTSEPALAAGKDWLQNCISVVWMAYPDAATAGNDSRCYLEPVADVFAMRDQRFTVFYENKVSSAEVVGMFAEVPSDSVVELIVHLDEISVGELWVGMLGDANFDAKGLVVAAPEGNAKNSAFSVRTMPGVKELTLTNKFKKDTGDYLISFDVSPNSVVLTLEKYTTFNPVAVPSDKKYLFIGYRALAPSTNHIEGSFFDLKITPR